MEGESTSPLAIGHPDPHHSMLIFCCLPSTKGWYSITVSPLKSAQQPTWHDSWTWRLKLERVTHIRINNGQEIHKFPIDFPKKKKGKRIQKKGFGMGKGSNGWGGVNGEGRNGGDAVESLMRNRERWRWCREVTGDRSWMVKWPRCDWGLRPTVLVT